MFDRYRKWVHHYGWYAEQKDPASGGAGLGIATDLRVTDTADQQVGSARLAADGLCENAVRLSAAEAELHRSHLTDKTIATAAAAAGGHDR